MGIPAHGDKPRRPRWLRWVLAVPLLFLLASALQVAILRFVDPPFSTFMGIRQIEAWKHGEWDYRSAHAWRDIEDISMHLPVALVAAEDQNFAIHHGFDLKAIEKARQQNARGRKVRGASTISQQLAKNLFLWSGRSWVRKGIEAWYTLLIETMLPKARILELYANFAEFGDGVYGAQAAAKTYFGRDARHLTAAQCARLAAVLPNPKKYKAGSPGPYVQRRARAIERQMRQIGGAGYLRTLD